MIVSPWLLQEVVDPDLSKRSQGAGVQRPVGLRVPGHMTHNAMTQRTHADTNTRGGWAGSNQQEADGHAPDLSGQ